MGSVGATTGRDTTNNKQQQTAVHREDHGQRRTSQVIHPGQQKVVHGLRPEVVGYLGASDISLISDRFGLDQGELKNIVHDILEMNLSDDFDLGSEDGMSEYGESEEPGVSIWQELQDETVRLDSRKSSSSSQASTDSLDSAEDFKPVEINLGEIREMLSMYINKRKVSNTLLTGTKQ